MIFSLTAHRFSRMIVVCGTTRLGSSHACRKTTWMPGRDQSLDSTGSNLTRDRS